MARFTKHKKSSRGEAFRCCRCVEPISVGQEYYTWAFAFGATYYQHATHGIPKPSQLTQSKLSGVYAAIEAAEEDLSSAVSVEDLQIALASCKDAIEEVRDEYQEGLDNMPDGLRDAATETQEKIDALDDFASSLESCADNLEEFDEDEPEIDEQVIKDWEDSEPEVDDEVEHAKWELREPVVTAADRVRWEEERDQWLEDRRSEASEALGELSI